MGEVFSGKKKHQGDKGDGYGEMLTRNNPNVNLNSSLSTFPCIHIFESRVGLASLCSCLRLIRYLVPELKVNSPFEIDQRGVTTKNVHREVSKSHIRTR